MFPRKSMILEYHYARNRIYARFAHVGHRFRKRIVELRPVVFCIDYHRGEVCFFYECNERREPCGIFCRARGKIYGPHGSGGNGCKQYTRRSAGFVFLCAENIPAAYGTRCKIAHKPRLRPPEHFKRKKSAKKSAKTYKHRYDNARISPHASIIPRTVKRKYPASHRHTDVEQNKLRIAHANFKPPKNS